MSELELLSDVSQLLCGTASHYTLTRGIVEALAIPRPDLALTIIEQYNYESRRMKLFLTLLGYARVPLPTRSHSKVLRH